MSALSELSRSRDDAIGVSTEDCGLAVVGTAPTVQLRNVAIHIRVQRSIISRCHPRSYGPGQQDRGNDVHDDVRGVPAVGGP